MQSQPLLPRSAHVPEQHCPEFLQLWLFGMHLANSMWLGRLMGYLGVSGAATVGADADPANSKAAKLAANTSIKVAKRM